MTAPDTARTVTCPVCGGAVPVTASEATAACSACAARGVKTILRARRCEFCRAPQLLTSRARARCTVCGKRFSPVLAEDVPIASVGAGADLPRADGGVERTEGTPGPSPQPFPDPPTSLAEVPVIEDPGARRTVRWETVFVMLAFLAPAVVTAIVVLAEHVASGATFHLFPAYVSGHPALNLVLGILAYLPVAAIVPLALLLLARTGQPPRSLGLLPSFRRSDLTRGVGLAAGAFGAELLLAVFLSPLLRPHRGVNVISIGTVPAYYIAWGLMIALTTAVTEEVLVNGYLVTRLQQLGWAEWPALWLSLLLRTSYHIYYGLGFLLTAPFGFFATRSFQKHRRLNRVIAAHFVYDSVIVAIAIFVRR